MISRISIIVAVGFIPIACGLVRERRSAYDVALNCTKVGWEADVSTLRADGGPADKAQKLESGCSYLREFSRCIVQVDPAKYSAPFPNIVHFLVAYQWQHNSLSQRAGLCENLMVGELKKLALQSGIMEEENLKNVEKYRYKHCAGRALRRCSIRAQTLMENGISQDFLGAMTDYISCIEKEGATCNAAILRHFIDVMKAYRRYLEENRNEYGKMVDKIPLPPGPR